MKLTWDFAIPCQTGPDGCKETWPATDVTTRCECRIGGRVRAYRTGAPRQRPCSRFLCLPRCGGWRWHFEEVGNWIKQRVAGVGFDSTPPTIRWVRPSCLPLCHRPSLSLRTRCYWRNVGGDSMSEFERDVKRNERPDLVAAGCG
jgi:hypothetical protein